MTIPSERVFMNAYDTNLAIAEQMPFRWHWAVGIVLFLLGCTIENPGAILQDVAALAVGMFFFGLIGGVISKIILVRLLPSLYAMLAMRLGLGSHAA